MLNMSLSRSDTLLKSIRNNNIKKKNIPICVLQQLASDEISKTFDDIRGDFESEYKKERDFCSNFYNERCQIFEEKLNQNIYLSPSSISDRALHMVKHVNVSKKLLLDSLDKLKVFFHTNIPLLSLQSAFLSLIQTEILKEVAILQQVVEEYNSYIIRIKIEIEKVCGQAMKYQQRSWFEHMFFEKRFVVVKEDDLKEKSVSVNGLPPTFQNYIVSNSLYSSADVSARRYKDA
jgi:hypothetical protein